MKNLIPVCLLIAAMTLSGCAWTKRHLPWHHEKKPAATKTTTSKSASKSATIVTPDESLSATVLKVNTVGRFVILNFPAGQMPKVGQHLFIYRAGLKVAEVKVSGPQEETSIVADIVSGEAQAGDSVRDQ